jgi:phosphoribosylanthranilate isomerase
MTTQVKICGIAREEDAEAAAEAGAAMIGFIFVPSSPRFIRPVDAARIVRTLPPSVLPVGVFVDASREDVDRSVVESGVRCIQLHGDEPPGETQGYAVPVIKGIRVRPGFDPEIIRRYNVQAILLDAFVEGRHGGTGVSFDWAIATKAASLARIVLSGGLTSENVREAIRRVRPYAVDVSSGVERSPGIKDHEKIRRFIEAVQSIPVLGDVRS